ncbi:MAG: DUF1822 family protein [Symploca sp. SIO3E6]|nr:DUF1822 family protein [Caldora sp. SIO3E6]
MQTKESLNFRVALTPKAHRLADKFCQQQGTLPKAEQVYLNTLAVCAVNDYLQQQGLATDLAASDSQDGIMQTGLDVADLVVKNCGKLECRIVQPEAEVVAIPEEVWQGRIGYVAVQLNESLAEARLLGFVARVTSRELPLNQLQSVADLPAYLLNAKPLVHLSQWWEGVFEAGWQTVEALLGNPSQELAFGFRKATPLTAERMPKRGKLIDLGMELGSQKLALLVALTRESDEKVGIRVQVHRVDKESYLPTGLKLVMLSTSGEILQEVQARDQDQYIQIKRFKTKPGKGFRIQLAVDNFCVEEEFVC